MARNKLTDEEFEQMSEEEYKAWVDSEDRADARNEKYRDKKKMGRNKSAADYDFSQSEGPEVFHSTKKKSKKPIDANKLLSIYGNRLRVARESGDDQRAGEVVKEYGFKAVENNQMIAAEKKAKARSKQKKGSIAGGDFEWQR